MNIRAKKIKIIFDNKSEDSWEATCQSGISFDDAMHMIARAWKEHDGPLIADDDERELVRKWASVYFVQKVIARRQRDNYTIDLVDYDDETRILVIDDYARITDGTYTITELCG